MKVPLTRQGAIVLYQAGIVLAAAACVWAQGEAVSAERPGADDSRQAVRPGDRDDGPRRGMGPRSDAERPGPDFDRVIDADIAWLRANDLAAFADRLTELRNSRSPMRRILLWRVHRRIEGWQHLQGDDARRALEAARLEFDIPRLAAEARAAEGGDAFEAARKKLHDAVARQTDLRVEVGKALIDQARKRLEGLREQIQKQEALRDDLIAQRLATLTDPATPLPDPLMEMASEEVEEGRERPPEGGERPAAEPPPSPPLGEQPLHERWAERFGQQVDNDVAWLRANGLEAYADRLAALREGDRDSGRTQFLLWQIHRRIGQLRSLPEEKRRDAIEGERLRFDIVDLARRWREAAEDARPAIAAKLREVLGRQFTLRQQAQKAIADGIQARLDEARGHAQDILKNRDSLINRRMEELLDRNKPLPEPQLLPGLRPPGSGQGERTGRPGRPERGEPRFRRDDSSPPSD